MKSKTELAEGIFTKIVGTMKVTLLTNEHDEKFKKRWVRHMEDLAEASLVAAEVFQKKTSATLPAVVAAEEKVTKAPEWDLRPGTVVKAVANFDKEVLPVLEETMASSSSTPMSMVTAPVLLRLLVPKQSSMVRSTSSVSTLGKRRHCSQENSERKNPPWRNCFQ